MEYIFFVYIGCWFLFLFTVIWTQRSSSSVARGIRQYVNSFKFFLITFAVMTAFIGFGSHMGGEAYKTVDNGHVQSMFQDARENMPAEGEEVTTYHLHQLVILLEMMESQEKSRRGFDALAATLMQMVLISGGAVIGYFAVVAMREN